MGETISKTICRPPRARSSQKGHLSVLPTAPAARRRSLPLLRAAHFSSACKHWERRQRLARICRCVDRGLASGKPLGRMLRIHSWRWRNRYYTSAPARRIRFSRETLDRQYRAWRNSGGNPAALETRYRAPVKLRKGHAGQFAAICINSEARSFAEAYGRLPRPRATVYAYRIALGAMLLPRVVKLFAARRLVDVRTRKARTAANRLALEGAK